MAAFTDLTPQPNARIFVECLLFTAIAVHGDPERVAVR